MNSIRLAPIQLASRLLRRDWRSGELRLLAIALVVAVASISAVGFFTDRIQAAMNSQASAVLGADLVFESASPAAKEWLQIASELGLKTAQTASFPSVLVLQGKPQLVQIKAVSKHYPLRGQLQTRPTRGASPEVGSAWIEPRLALTGKLASGDSLKVGRATLNLSAILTHEPDRAANLFQLAPRLMMSLQDLPSTGLTGPASRIKHRLLLAGTRGALADFRQQINRKGLPRSSRWVDVRNARPELRSALERADAFLRLSALTAVLLSVVAIALGMRRFIERQTDSSALLRCLGASSGQIAQIFAWRLLFIGLAAGLVGNLLGLLAQSILSAIIAQWFTDQLPAPSWWPLFNGLATSLLVLAGFALPAIWRLAKVSPLRILRRDLPAPSPRLWIAALLPLASLLSLMIWQLGNEALAWRLIGGLIAALAMFWLVSRGLVSVLKLLRKRSSGSWRFGLAALARQPTTTTLQLTGFGIGLTVLLVLALVRVELMQNWQTSLPENTPNHFLINIQPDEVEDVASYLSNAGLPASPMYPIIRARLTHINAQVIHAEQFSSAKGKRMAVREFSLTWSNQLPSDNRILAGQWWHKNTSAPAHNPTYNPEQVSLEEGLAKALKLELGDTLSFDIAGQTINARITSLRKVQWDSFNANFFIIGTPELFKDIPTTYISSFYLPQSPQASVHSDQLLSRLIESWPSVTPINISALIQQVKGIMERGSLAIEFVFLFTLLASLVVLYTGIQVSREQRIQETALLRTLGLSQSKILFATVLEFGLLGTIAAVLAASFATAIGYGLAISVFNLPWSPSWQLWLVAMPLSALGITLAGVLATRQLVTTPPLVSLRKQ